MSAKLSIELILDISRLFSRRHYNHDTGIDRVERGYLDHFKSLPDTAFLTKFAGYYFIVSHNELDQVFAIAPQKTSSVLEKIRIFRSLQKLSKQSGMPQKISTYRGATFINVGHTGHKPVFWKTVKSAEIKIIIMIHDVIPLDFPEFSRPDKLSVFKRKFQNWCQFADIILAPSAYSKDRILNWSKSNTEVKVTPLFVPFHSLPKVQSPTNAWIILGTIEPRKNHQFLFQTWELLVAELGDKAPQLWIIGARGWPEPQTVEFLDNSPLMGKHVIEWGTIDDEGLSQMMADARGLLFPSACEGFGLPIYEAVLNKKPLFAARIPAFEEALGANSDCLLDTNDYNIWKEAIMGQPKFGSVTPVISWNAHIETALK